MHENANNAIPQRRRQAFGGRWMAIESLWRLTEGCLSALSRILLAARASANIHSLTKFSNCCLRLSKAACRRQHVEGQLVEGNMSKGSLSKAACRSEKIKGQSFRFIPFYVDRPGLEPGLF